MHFDSSDILGTGAGVSTLEVPSICDKLEFPCEDAMDVERSDRLEARVCRKFGVCLVIVVVFRVVRRGHKLVRYVQEK